jgi:hypothetical protein
VPPLSIHFRFASLILPSLGAVSHTGNFLIGTTAPDAFEPEREDSFSRHHFINETGHISLPDFVQTTGFLLRPADHPAWSFTCGYYCHLWLDVFYRNNMGRIPIRRPDGMLDAEVRRHVRRETEILNASFVLDAADQPIPQPEELCLPIGLKFIDTERCIQLFHEVIKQSREWSTLSIEFELIDRVEYTTILENAVTLFMNEIQILR